jgi:hypothetical protein
MADQDILELNQMIADFGTEYQSPDRRQGPSLASARLYKDYTPASPSQQAEMIMSMLPGVGEGLDAAHFAKDMGDGNYGQAGLSGLSLALPFVGAATIKRVASKLEVDNPGGSWLRDKKEDAAEAMAKAEPDTYRKNLGTTAITGYHKGVVELDPKQLSDIPGAMSEELSRMSGEKLGNLQKSIKAEGYNPSPILIHVREDGQPFIVEGNTRVAEAIVSDRPTIQAEIKYLRGAEEVEGPLSPDKIFEMPKPPIMRLRGSTRNSDPDQMGYAETRKSGTAVNRQVLKKDDSMSVPPIDNPSLKLEEFDAGMGFHQLSTPDNSVNLIGGTPVRGSSDYTVLHYGVADESGKNLVGNVKLRRDATTGQINGIVDIEIKPEYRKQGYAKKILEALRASTEGADLNIFDIQNTKYFTNYAKTLPSYKIKQFKKGGSVVERSNNYEPKAI